MSLLKFLWLLYVSDCLTLKECLSSLSVQRSHRLFSKLWMGLIWVFCWSQR